MLLIYYICIDMKILISYTFQIDEQTDESIVSANLNLIFVSGKSIQCRMKNRCSI